MTTEYKILKNANTFKFDKCLMEFIASTPFYAEISRHIRKSPTKSVDTLMVCYDPKVDDFALLWNPDFCDSWYQKDTSGTWNKNFLLHEFKHVLFDHLTTRRKNPNSAWNIATDLAINGIIVDGYKGGEKRPVVALPIGVIPGQWPRNPDGSEMDPLKRKPGSLGDIISQLIPLQSSEYYFEKLKQEYEKQKGKGDKPDGTIPSGNDNQKKSQDDQNIGNTSLEDLFSGKCDGSSLDGHKAWDDLTDEQRTLAQAKIREIVEKAVNAADAKANGWGNIPAYLREEIRKSISRKIDWKLLLKQWTGNLVRGRKSLSFKRINKRYPMVHPGTTKGYTAHLLIAIDQSGSVDDKMLEEFFAELRNANKKIKIDILPFDYTASVKEVYTWARGACPKAVRTRTGGTNFDAPTAIINDPKNRGRWDGLLIMTDGMAAAPGPSRLKRGWIIGKGCKMEFQTPETVINLGEVNKKPGAWR